MTALARLCALALAIVAAAGTTARADDRYPSRVITIVVPLTPGTAIDIQARLYADGLAKRFGYQAVVVNRAGAGTLIGAETVANSSPDGYTVLLTNSAHAILGAMNRNLPFDPIADFAGICMVAQAPTVIAVPPSLGVHNLQEFVALAKAKPGPGQWSILECLEHVAITEERGRTRLETAPKDGAPGIDKEKEARLTEQALDRSVTIQAPEAITPKGRFASLAEAL